MGQREHCRGPVAVSPKDAITRTTRNSAKPSAPERIARRRAESCSPPPRPPQRSVNYNHAHRTGEYQPRPGAAVHIFIGGIVIFGRQSAPADSRRVDGIAPTHCCPPRRNGAPLSRLRRVPGSLATLATCAQAIVEPVEIEIDHRRRVERQHLADEQPADDGDAERLAQFRAAPCPSASGRPPSIAAIVVIMIGRKRSRQACVDRLVGLQSRARSASSAKSIIMMRVLLDDADQQDDADQRDDARDRSGTASAPAARRRRPTAASRGS